MFDYEKILEALQVIKDVCEKAVDCQECPLGNSDNDCLVMAYSPKDIELVDLKEPQVIRLISN